MKNLFWFTIFTFTFLTAFTQKQWTLKECIDYALENNLDIKKRELVKQNSELNLKSSKLSMLPNLNGNIGERFSFGRSTSSDGVIVNKNADNTSFGVSSSMPLFQGFKIYNQIESNKLNLQASLEDLNQVKNDMALNITSQYLQVLFAKEIYQIALDQIVLSEKQLEKIEQLVNAGSKSKADLYEGKATLARDKSTAVQQQNEIKLLLLNLAQLLDIKADVEVFDIIVPQTDLTNSIQLNFVLDKESLQNISLNYPSIKASEYRLKASEKDAKIAKSYYYPNLDFTAGYGTGYYSSLLDKMLDPTSGIMPFGKQLDINQQFSLGFGLSIPIFNRMSTFYGVKSAKLNIISNRIDLENSHKQFVNEVQKAYYNAIAAKEKMNSSTETKLASEEAFRYASEKYTAGKSSVYELDEAKSRLMKANSEYAQAKYEYIFRTKILDFYNGKSLEL